MSKLTKNFLLIAVIIVALAMIGVCNAIRKPPKRISHPLPIPNGYTAFVQAGKLVKQDSGNFATMDLEKLRATAAGNSNALTIARAGLLERSQVPLVPSQAYMTTHLPELSGLKELAFAFVAEGRLAEMEQRTNDAANSYLDTIHLGFESERGGVVIDALVGFAIEAIGTARLQKIIDCLDEKTCADLAHKIESLDAQQEPWNQILQNEHDWSQSTFGFQQWVGELFAWNARKASIAKSTARFNAQKTRIRRLMVNLAARAYELEKAHPPGKIADMVPTYLKAIPQDPVTGAKMTLTP